MWLPALCLWTGPISKPTPISKKTVKEEVPIEAKRYAKELMEEVNKDREAHGKKPFEEEDNSELPA